LSKNLHSAVVVRLDTRFFEKCVCATTYCDDICYKAQPIKSLSTIELTIKVEA